MDPTSFLLILCLSEITWLKDIQQVPHLFMDALPYNGSIR